MKKDLLLALADKLDALPEERFNYGVWAGYTWGGKADLSCGTSACALGWATTMPECGLELRRNSDRQVYVARIGDGDNDPWDIGWTSVHAAERAFEITEDEAAYLFIPGENGLGDEDEVSANEVATMIRDFVKRGGVPDAQDMLAEES